MLGQMANQACLAGAEKRTLALLLLIVLCV
jgi:hypothetical protein